MIVVLIPIAAGLRWWKKPPAVQAEWPTHQCERGSEEVPHALVFHEMCHYMMVACSKHDCAWSYHGDCVMMIT